MSDEKKPEESGTSTYTTASTGSGTYTFQWNGPYVKVDWKFCPYCGQKLESEWKYCAGCGKELVGTIALQRYEPYIPWYFPWYPPYPVYPSSPPIITWGTCTATGGGSDIGNLSGNAAGSISV